MNTNNIIKNIGMIENCIFSCQKNPFILRFASDKHKNDREIVIRTVKKKRFVDT